MTLTVRRKGCMRKLLEVFSAVCLFGTTDISSSLNFGFLFVAAADTVCLSLSDARATILTRVTKSVSVLSTFFLAMILHPEAQKKAQEEIDAVIEQDRMPDFRDRQSLPYVDALLLEVLRWQPALPLGNNRCLYIAIFLISTSGVPHAADKDTVLDGVFIPKGGIH